MGLVNNQEESIQYRKYRHLKLKNQCSIETRTCVWYNASTLMSIPKSLNAERGYT